MYVDIHSHIIPGIDDGAADEETALKMLTIAWNNGTGHIVATPHYIHGNSCFDFNEISEECRKLRRIAAAHNLSIAIHTGCEVFLNPDLSELYDDGSIITINQSSYILIELPMTSIPGYTDEILYKLQLKGVIPVIAHPERNEDIIKNPDILSGMVSRGILTQVNSGSITGLYGREIQKVSMRLIKKGYAHLAGSDAHTCNGRSPALDEAARIVETKFGTDTVKKLFVRNGLALLKNERIGPNPFENVSKVKGAINMPDKKNEYDSPISDGGKMRVLVTGGAGYIGSHTLVELLNAGHEAIVVDNLSNSKIESLNRVKKITGKDFKFYQTDLLDKPSLSKIFASNRIDLVIHFAGLKAVGESVSIPLDYYRNNIAGTVNLCEAMRDAGVKRMVFSSSATVYGVPEKVPITEVFPLGATNPYGRTKLMIEEILRDLSVSDNEWSITMLRYFNPVGAHESGTIGEDPNGVPNNLMPFITQVAVGKLSELKVFGNDYPTPDGTGIRDYIHVVDLAKGHLKALEKVTGTGKTGVEVFNLGGGRGYSVLEMISAFKDATGIKIPYRITERRPGDIASCYADCSKAKRELGWSAEKGLKEMCLDSWRWQRMNPEGYN